MTGDDRPVAPPPPASPLLSEHTRPHADLGAAAPPTVQGRANQQLLLQVHDQLRHELAEIQRLAAQVGRGRLEAATARSMLNRMAVRQNFWTFGAFCAQYCRVVTVHHTIEDRMMFPALREEDERLSAVIGRLSEEHEIIAAVVQRLDQALVAMLTEPNGAEHVAGVAAELSDALLSHLAYEENELLGPLGHSSITI